MRAPRPSRNPWSAGQFLAAFGLEISEENKDEFNRRFAKYSRQSRIDHESAWTTLRESYGAADDPKIKEKLWQRYNKNEGRRRNKAVSRGENNHMSRVSARDQPKQPSVAKILWIFHPDCGTQQGRRESSTATATQYPQSLWIDIVKEVGGEEQYEWLDSRFRNHVPLDLRPHVCNERGTKLHQALVTMLIAKHKSTVPVEIQSWEWLQKKTNKKNGLQQYLKDRTGTPTPAAVVIQCTTAKPNNLIAVVKRLEELPKVVVARVWPGSAEIEQDLKKRDWQVLDEIAAAAAAGAKPGNSPDYTFRPLTCPGKGPCKLDGITTTVAKRDFSNGGRHVRTLHWPDRGHLQCTPRNDPINPSDREGYQWHHQEYISSLDLMEFRVVIAMRKHPNGVRGVIVSKVTTKPVLGGECFARAFDANTDLKHPFCHGLTEAKLNEYALWMVDRLLERDNEKYRSVVTGVRLDIGVYHGKLFVNEIVRANSAHWWSAESTPKPHLRPCMDMAISLLEHLGCLRTEEGTVSTASTA